MTLVEDVRVPTEKAGVTMTFLSSAHQQTALNYKSTELESDLHEKVYIKNTANSSRITGNGRKKMTTNQCSRHIITSPQNKLCNYVDRLQSYREDDPS